MISGHGHNPPFDESVSLCLHFLGTRPTKAFRACAQLRVCVCVSISVRVWLLPEQGPSEDIT